MMNVSDSPFAGRLDLDPTDYGLAGKPLTVTAIQPDGTQVPFAVQAIDQADMELPARSILTWEVRRAAGKWRSAAAMVPPVLVYGAGSVLIVVTALNNST